MREFGKSVKSVSWVWRLFSLVLIKPYLLLKLCVCEIWFWSVERSWVERVMGSFSEAFIAFFC